MSPAGPEDKAREEIDRMLAAAGWHGCDYCAPDMASASMTPSIRAF